MRKNRKGNIAIESIFSFMIFVSILSATIDYGMYFHAQSSLVQTTHLATQAISMDPEGFLSARLNSEISFEEATGKQADFTIEIDQNYVTVLGRAPYEPLIGLFAAPSEHMHISKSRIIWEF